MTYPIKGVPVTLHEKVSAGKDAFNHEIFEETDILIDNVLIAPLSQSGEEILTEINLTGKEFDLLELLILNPKSMCCLPPAKR